ncbi:hybrid sensor histidine kinase/response regulator [Dethiosulfatarculus sandiegensis]|uniref:histidine kinase n=1 Tax=Dethiosulfatarculus sandiegensis TaxID=1429043 RepID=A0A0D2HUJ3_9BACT|nr:PAS domain-containing sensor histidine kinase [Dethiosulfatarculus sandiegensis]KIX14113.1 hypothetical protein X474_10800 [Dethiosulfatarculus sandiegensis]
MDINKKHHILKKQLKEQSVHLKSLLENASTYAIFQLYDESDDFNETELIYASPAVCDILGLDAPVTYEDWWKIIHPDDLKGFAKADKDAGKTGFLRTACRIFHARKNAWRWIQVESSLVRETSQDPFIFNGIIYDITERKEAELAASEQRENLQKSLDYHSERLVQANLRLRKEVAQKKEAQAALQELASGVAHNFNNILMAVASNTQAALGYLVEPQKAVKHLQNVLAGVDNGRDIVKRLLDNVLNNPKDESGILPIDLASLLKKTVKLINGTWPILTNPQISLDIKVLESDCPVMIPEGQLMEVLFNFFKNSAEAINGEGRIKTGLLKKNQKAVIWIQDNGPGVRPENIKKLFNPFFTTKGALGQGLGLAISKKIITDFKGKVNYLGKPDSGAFFTIELPLAKTAEISARSEKKNGSIGLTGLDILLIEDEALVAMGMESFLNRQGCRVRQVSSVAKAMAEIRKKPPQFVVCDFGLPDGNACDVKHELTKIQCTAPVVFLTGWCKEQIIAKPGFAACLPDALLQKPISNNELLEVIKQNLN